MKSSTISAFVAGAIFAAGLLIGGMTQPSKVIGFLDVAGDWDPSLIFVMGGAIVVLMPLLWIIRKSRTEPLFGPVFSMPTRRDLDAPLIVGSAVFGVGWGIAGYCPGPALTSLGGGGANAFMFTAAMLAGFALKHGYTVLRAARERRHA